MKAILLISTNTEKSTVGGTIMEFEPSTKWLLKKIMRDLNEEATTYDWGSKEYEFLTDVVSEIENAIWVGK